MKRLTNTELFHLLEKMDGTFNPCECDIRLAYEKFVHKVTSLCTSEKGDIPVYFTIHYTCLELQQLQTLLNNEKMKKKISNSKLHFS